MDKATMDTQLLLVRGLLLYINARTPRLYLFAAHLYINARTERLSLLSASLLASRGQPRLL